MTFVERRYPEWERKYGKEMADKLRDKYRAMFGDSDLNTKEEVLMAISTVSHHLNKSTGERKYKDMEDIALSMVDDIGKGLTDKSVVDRAIKEAKRRGYKEKI